MGRKKGNDIKASRCPHSSVVKSLGWGVRPPPVKHQLVTLGKFLNHSLSVGFLFCFVSLVLVYFNASVSAVCTARRAMPGIWYKLKIPNKWTNTLNLSKNFHSYKLKILSNQVVVKAHVKRPEQCQASQKALNKVSFWEVLLPPVCYNKQLRIT